MLRGGHSGKREGKEGREEWKEGLQVMMAGGKGGEKGRGDMDTEVGRGKRSIEGLTRPCEGGRERRRGIVWDSGVRGGG